MTLRATGAVLFLGFAILASAQKPLGNDYGLDATPTAAAAAPDTDLSKAAPVTTPAPVARFMASLLSRTDEQVRLLDAGAGIGSILTDDWDRVKAM